MGESKDKLLSESIGKTISVFYNDTAHSVSFKTGKFLDFDGSNVKLVENSSGNRVLIPREKCIRIEFGGEKQHVQATAR